MVRGGLWVSGIAAVIFFVGAWFFEAVFAGNVPEVAEWWPIGLVFLGGVLVLRTFFLPGRPSEPQHSPDVR